MEKKLYTVKEVSEILNFKPDTIRTWLKSGRIKGRKVMGNNWRIHIDDLQDVLDEETKMTRRTFPPLRATGTTD